MKNPRINKGDRQPTVQTQIIYALIHRPSFVLSFIPFLAALGTFAASAQTVFVVNSGSGNVSVIQAASNTVIDTVPVGVRPMHAEVSPDGRRVYVSNQGSDTVSVIDVASRAVVATIPVGHSPFGVAASLDNLKVYVTHDSGADEDFVWVIDVQTLTASLAFSLPNQADAAPTATFYPNGSEIWIKNGCGDQCTRRVSYPDNVVLGDLPLETAGANATENHFSFVPGTSFLYAAHSCGCCGHFDRSQYAPTITYTGRRYEDGRGSAVWTVASPTGGIVYLARVTHCTTPSTIIRKESAASDTTLATLTIPEFFTEVGAITPDGAHLYLTTLMPDGTLPSVAVVDTATMSVVATIPVGDQPFGIAISPIDSGVAPCPAGFEFSGFLAPVSGADATGGSFSAPLRTFKLNSTIPLKFTISCSGSPIRTGVHTLQVVKWSDETTAGPALDATPTDAATTGNQFRLTDDEWHFNLSTRATGMSVGKWQLIATLSDGSEHSAWIQLK